LRSEANKFLVAALDQTNIVSFFDRQGKISHHDPIAAGWPVQPALTESAAMTNKKENGQKYKPYFCPSLFRWAGKARSNALPAG